jgi:hypothetical protein
LRADDAFLFRQSRRQGLVDSRQAEVFSVREQVPVGVHRLGNGGVTQRGLDDLRVQVGGDQHRGVEMPQIMDPGPGWKNVRKVGARPAAARLAG